MAKRVFFGALMIAGVSAVLWLDWHLQRPLGFLRGQYRLQDAMKGLPVTLLLAVIAVRAFAELSHLAAASGVRLLPVSGAAGAALLATAGYWVRWVALLALPAFTHVTLLAVLTAAIFAEQMVRHRLDDATRRIAFTLLAVVYLGIGGTLVLSIRMYEGVAVLAWFVAVVKTTDIGAYFIGTAIGRHKLIAWLSPGKSWEGLFGGLAFGAGAGVLLAWALKIIAVADLWQAGVMAAMLGLAGQFGDLCESLLKRSASAKDSGALVPEFGGVLDIIDSILMAAPVAAILLTFRPMGGG